MEALVGVRATATDSVLSRLDISRLRTSDRFDSQGIDLRLINSISSDVLSRVMAIDTEPGLIDIYQGEDLFVDVHRDLTSNGFWLWNAYRWLFCPNAQGDALDLTQQANAKIDDVSAIHVGTVRTSPRNARGTISKGHSSGLPTNGLSQDRAAFCSGSSRLPATSWGSPWM